MTINHKWPSTPDNDLNPWYIILWRLPFWLMLVMLRVLCCIVVMCGFGPEYAIDYWEQSK